VTTSNATSLPRISVVMPAYNTERYITAAVRSALESGESAVEVLVIDDGSTDRTVETVRAIKDTRVRITSIAPSGGPSRPRNVGISQARAPYVALLDSDDLLKPHKLATSVAALDRNLSAGFAFGDYERIDADGRLLEASVLGGYPTFCGLSSIELKDSWRLIPQPELARGLLYENFIGTSGVVIRSDLARSLGGFDETLTCSEDRDMWFRLARCCDALYSPRIGHSYRKHESSLTQRPSIRCALSQIKVLRGEKAHWRDRASRRQLNRRISEHLAGIGYRRREQCQRWAAVWAFSRAFLTSPELRWIRGLLGSLVRQP
jgi:glycosyltransferase involved in cell wall biosynthesis